MVYPNLNFPEIAEKIPGSIAVTINPSSLAEYKK